MSEGLRTSSPDRNIEISKFRLLLNNGLGMECLVRDLLGLFLRVRRVVLAPKTDRTRSEALVCLLTVSVREGRRRPVFFGMGLWGAAGSSDDSSKAAIIASISGV